MQVEHCGDTGKIILAGRVDLENSELLKSSLQSLFDRGFTTISVDCGNLALMDSAGIGILVLFQKRLKERGGHLKLVNVRHPYVKRLFRMLELARIIAIEEN